MAGSLGSLVVSFGLDAAQFVSGMTKAEFEAKKFADRTARELERTKESLGVISARFGAVAIAAAGAFAVINSQAMALDQFNDLSDATGSSIEKLAALDKTARQTGTTFETLSSALIKLNMSLGSAKDGDDISRVVNALGLSLKELRGLDPAEAFERIAVALNGFADDGNKARAAQELFGKSLKEVAPLLKDVAERGVTASEGIRQAAEEADKFSKNVAGVNAALTDMSRSLTGDALIGINGLIDKFKEGAREGEGFLKTLLRQTEIARLLGQSAAPSGFTAAREELERIQRVLDANDRRSRTGDVGIQSMLKREAELQGVLAGYLNSTAGAGRGVSGYGNLPKGSLEVAAKAETKKGLSDLEKFEKEIQERLRKDRLAGVLAEYDERQKMADEQAQREIDLGKRVAEEARRNTEEARKLAESVETPFERMQRKLEEIASFAENNPIISADTVARLNTQAWQEYIGSLDVAAQKTTELDNFTKKAAENIQDQLGDGLYNLLNGSFTNIGKSFANMITRMVAEAQAARIARALFGESVSGGSGQGMLGDLLGSFGSLLFGGGSGSVGMPDNVPTRGGRAIGGPVDAGGIYEVAERGPEMLDVNGRKFLLMGRNKGNIDANPGGGGGGDTYVFNGGVSRAEVIAGMNRARVQAVTDVYEARRRGAALA